MIYFVYLLLGTLNGLMDTIDFHWPSSVLKKIKHYKINEFFSIWAMHNAKNDENGNRKMLFWRIPRPVFTCDGWHLSKSFLLWGICFFPLFHVYILFDNTIYNALANVFMLRSCFGIGFVLMYDIILRNGKKINILPKKKKRDS